VYHRIALPKKGRKGKKGKGKGVDKFVGITERNWVSSFHLRRPRPISLRGKRVEARETTKRQYYRLLKNTFERRTISGSPEKKKGREEGGQFGGGE